MAKEAVDKILSAEAQADKIRSDASDMAKETARRAASEASELISADRKRAEAEAERIILEARKRADEILSAVSAEDDSDCKALKETITQRLGDVSQSLTELIKD